MKIRKDHKINDHINLELHINVHAGSSLCTTYLCSGSVDTVRA